MDSLPDNVLATKAEKKEKARFGGSRHEDDNVISDGSVVAVADGQCMMIVDQGKIVDFCAEPGEYVFEQGDEPSIFCGPLNDKKMKAVLKTTFDRLSFGGQANRDQQVYFFNTKEILGNKYGTPSTVSFRVVDSNIGLNMDVSIRCFGEYSYRITNPTLFYVNVCGNVEGDYTPRADRQPAQERAADGAPARLREDFGDGHSLQRAAGSYDGDRSGAQRRPFRKMGQPARRGNRLLRRELRQGLRRGRGDDQGASAQRRIPQCQHGGGAHLVGADAAKNQGGAFTGFVGMNMAQQGGGMNAAQLFQMGATATGKFCSECGAKRPSGAPVYRRDKCSWQPAEILPRMRRSL